MERTIRAVIFDQDGLMFDTERLSSEAWNLAGAGMGVHLEESFLCTIRGMVWAGAKKRFEEEFGTDFDAGSLREGKQREFRRLLAERGVPVKPGLRGLLAYLKEHRYKICMGSASSRDYCESNLKETGLDGYFRGIISGDMVSHAKPDPEIFLRAAELMGEKPENCLVLEDSLNGVRAGLDGGFHVIMVPDLTQPDEELSSRVDFVCASLADVPGCLEKLEE